MDVHVLLSWLITGAAVLTSSMLAAIFVLPALIDDISVINPAYKGQIGCVIFQTGEIHQWA